MRAPVTVETLLARIPLFNELDAPGISRIAKATRQISARRGEFLFSKNEQCTGFHALLSGQVKLAVTAPDGAEKVIKVFGEGDSFGEATMLLGVRYIAVAQALSDCLLLHVNKQAVLAEVQRDHPLRRKMLAGLARRVHQMMMDVESCALYSGQQRISAYLLGELAEETVSDDKVAVTLRANKGIIASQLSITQEHFSRTLQTMSKLGLIDVDGRTIHIPSVADLRKHAA